MGEKQKDFEPFHPERMASRILGMGDGVSLVGHAADAVSEADAKSSKKRCARASLRSKISWSNCAR